jgi:phosphotransferase family enzyme
LTAPLKRAEKHRLIDLLATWIVAMGKATAAAPTALESERTRLLIDVIPRWAARGAADELVLGLPDLPAVFQHNDLGSWNVLVRDSEFTVVDWESSRRHGLLLWDLLYFLADSLALLDGEVAGETRHRHTTALFRGETASSEILFGWIRKAVAEFEIAPETVGALATLCWLHHSLSHVDRRDSLDRLAPRSESPLHGSELVGAAWLADPALGPGWDRWRR